MEIEIGNIVRLKKQFECRQDDINWINVIDRTPLQVIATDYEKDIRWCLVAGDGFNLKTECSNLIKVKDKGIVPTTTV